MNIRHTLHRFLGSVSNLVSTKQPQSIARLGPSTPCHCGRSRRSSDSRGPMRYDAPEMRGVVRCSQDASEPCRIRTHNVYEHSRRLRDTSRCPE
ncbi:hypothetical protein AR158_C774L [Paramecium bursaria Chlorella virus AR158]|uniref:hypothetical protein n=1 Tax=Paramecium bursaria Chlorella virus AR158 TaxID=380598 RepID=UPI00015AA8D4|nr:hypothetical protein AR158_C774L [Paramecium bursaria Chlorella virus AR158]ABU44319.1 hypothetical protein AR158_C774L [Paramecium bursaria Chlorella virus AR158]